MILALLETAVPPGAGAPVCLIEFAFVSIDTINGFVYSHAGTITNSKTILIGGSKMKIKD